MSASITISLPLPTPVVLPVTHGRVRHIRADSVTVRSSYLCDARPSMRLCGPCLRADGTTAKRARNSYGGCGTAAVLSLSLPADDREVVEAALSAWRTAWAAAQEALS